MPLTDATHYVNIGAVSATADYFFFVTPEGGNIDVVAVDVISSTAIAVNATDKWTFQVTNVTDSTTLLSTAQTTASIGPIVAGVPYILVPDQNASSIGSGKTFKLTCTKGGSGATMANVLVRLRYRVRS